MKNENQPLIDANTYAGTKGKIIIFLMNFVHKSAHQWLIKTLNITKYSKVLDIGCGGGQLVSLISRKASEKTFGIDYSNDMISASKSKNQKKIKENKIEIKTASVSHLPYEDNHFDIVTAFETIQFWPDIVNDLKEIKRVLTSDGKLYIMNRLAKENSKWYEFSKLKTPNQYKVALQKAEYECIKIDITSKTRWILASAQK